jgi:hypothetical protein
MAQDRRLDLHSILVNLLGSNHVYFQPPSNVEMVYPCIVYKLAAFDTKYANNKLYNFRKRYEITVIDQDPDTGIPDKVLKLPLCRFDRPYVFENLNHYVFDLYY